VTGSAIAEAQGSTRRLRYALPFAGIWLLLLIQPATDAVDRATAPRQSFAAVVLLVVFAALYLWVVVMAWEPRNRRRGRFVAGALFLVGLAVVPFAGVSGLTTFVFVGVVVQLVLPWKAAAAASGALVLLAAGLAMVMGAEPFSWAFSVAAASMAMFGVARTVERNRALLEAQHDRERYAVLAERERFARDLHDILGHSLTVITVKSELAGRLVDRDVDRARAEITDIERLARQALADVRATAGNYRTISLAGEIAAARSALVAAGIEPDLPTALDDVPADLSEPFAYVVREGVTNVVRHSGATRCAVRVGPTCVDVVDDGHGTLAEPAGQGISGLRSRLHERGLLVEAGPSDGGGFRLRAQVGVAP
jgi:two-component system, NarL family, sensor histidine kinase DesK